MTTLYHWSPTDRRPGITRYGLVPGKRPVTHSSLDDAGSDKWRAPYLCFAEDPLWAWALSGDVAGEPGQQWDLWCVNLDTDSRDVYRLRHHPDERPHTCRWHEWRVFDRIYKRNVLYVASRTIPKRR